MNFNKINNLTGWITFAIAYATYLMTMESTASLWDCGEFMATAYKLEIAHSPGAPLFMMLGRLFGMFASTPQQIAPLINSMSALMSAFTILFLFWTITHFARRIVMPEGVQNIDKNNIIKIMGAGLVGALAYTFSDTFWFSAVESEVYATSSFFTAIVFWAALKWEHEADKAHADRWLVLVFYLMGLSVGVHLLNLLTIPAIIMVYYFKRYKPTLKGAIIAFLIGCVILGGVQIGVIQYLPIIASRFDLMFVNNLSLPFHSGLLFFVLLIAAISTFAIIWAKKTGRRLFHLSVLCFVFVVIGYSSYVSIVVRSKADVPINMGNPDNIMALIPYLQRDQYGSQPLVSGPDFDSKVIDVKDGRALYAAVQKDGKDYYEKTDHRSEYVFDKTRLFPRIWSFSDPNHENFYRSYLGLAQNESPSAADNYKFFFRYQFNWMYWRYFMWNYVGRQNDMQGQGEAIHGNWISGIKPIDKFFGRGDIDLAPDYYSKNRAYNKLYFLPFILGIIGLMLHVKTRKNDFAVIAVLFFFTGLAIQLYVNNTPLQPRERDYAYVSTYAFAIWIGIGVIAISNYLSKFLKGAAPVAATAVSLLAVPVLMASQEWDDHDRSKKTIARDHAYNLLSACDSNAILLTYGDNDTYPIWYLQEIEGFRRDVRVINYNLLGTDWQNEQLLSKINDADAVPVLWKEEHFRGTGLQQVPVQENPRIPQNRYFSLEEIINFLLDDKNKLPTRGGTQVSYIPTRKIAIPLDKEAVVKSGLVKPEDAHLIPEEIRFEIQKNVMVRNEIALMNILAGQAKTGWTRPIYMTDGTPNLGLDAYFRNEGTLRKFVPRMNKSPMPEVEIQNDLDKNFKLFTEVFTWGAANGDDVYYDEKNRLVFLVYRSKAAALANALSQAGRQQDAVKVVDMILEKISENALPIEVLNYDGGTVLHLINAYSRAGADDKAKNLADKLRENTEKKLKYFASIPTAAQSSGTNAFMIQQSNEVLGNLDALSQRFNTTIPTNNIEEDSNTQVIPAENE